MRILVTGSNGLLGQKLVSLLSSFPEVDLLATGRGSNRNPVGNYTYLSADLCSEPEVKALIAQSLPEVIIHCAAITQVDDCELYPEKCWSSNVTATEYLLAACRHTTVHFQYISTDFVFDGENGPYREDDEPNPVSYYGKSKLTAEQAVQKSGLRHSIVRTVLVYGVAHDLSRSNIVLWVKQCLEEHKPIKVVNDQWRTPTLAEDLALGCWLIIDKKQEGIFHISGEEGMTPFELANKVADSFELNRNLIIPVDASTFTQPGKRPPRTGFIVHKARNLLGFEPHGFVKGLEILKRQMEL